RLTSIDSSHIFCSCWLPPPVSLASLQALSKSNPFALSTLRCQGVSMIMQTYDVFLSYNNDDNEIVKQVAERLIDDHGLHPYFDSWEMIRGDQWRVALENGLAQSKACAIFISPSGLGTWENRELSAYLDMVVMDNKLRLIPVLLPGVNKKT